MTLRFGPPERRCVQLGELSSARQALEGAAFAPGTNATLSMLTESKRPARPRKALSREVLEHVPPLPFDLDEKLFFRCLRSSRRGEQLALLA